MDMVANVATVEAGKNRVKNTSKKISYSTAKDYLSALTAKLLIEIIYITLFSPSLIYCILIAYKI